MRLNKSHNGFLYVASLKNKFLRAARYSANSLRDYWPEANITLFTHKEWVKDSDYNIFNNIITKGVPYHHRAKLWALDKTLYELTCYIDCDTFIQHEDIKNIFNEHVNNYDITITKARDYAASIKSKFNGNELTDHCGLFIYNNKEHTLKFMNEWWELYCKQHSGEWKWDTKLYPEYLRPWDMWTYWWLQNMTKYKIKRNYFSDPDARWNFVYVYKDEELKGKDAVIIHQPVPRKL